MPTFPAPDSQHALAADCRRCAVLPESRDCISWGNGPLDAAVVVVGEGRPPVTPTPTAGGAGT